VLVTVVTDLYKDGALNQDSLTGLGIGLSNSYEPLESVTCDLKLRVGSIACL